MKIPHVMDIQRRVLAVMTVPETNSNWEKPVPLEPELLQVKPFSDDLLPPSLRAYVKDVSHRMQCPPDFIAVSLMVVLGSAIGTGCTAKPKQHDDWTVVPNLWGGIVAPPGAMKSPAMDAVTSLLVKLEEEQREEYESIRQSIELENELIEEKRKALIEQLKAAEREKAKGNDTKIDVNQLKKELLQLEDQKVARKRYKTDDASIEKMAELLNENPRGLLTTHDELIGLFSSWDQERKKSDRAFYLKGWNGYSSHTSDRIGRGTIETKNLCISLLGGIQPAKLKPYLLSSVNGFENDGLVQRLQLLTYPDDIANWQNIDKQPDHTAVREVQEKTKFVSDINFTDYGALQDEHSKYPFLRFSPEGQEVFDRWLTDLETNKIRGEVPPILKEHLSKYKSLMPSLALILHIVMSDRELRLKPISKEAAEMAVKWCDYLESHARRIYGLVLNKPDLAALKLLEKIKTGKLNEGFTIREVVRNNWEHLKSNGSAEQACRYLIECGYLKVDQVDQSGRAGRPTKRYQINPLVFELT